MQILALRTSTLYVKPSPAICLSTDPVRVRRSAKIGYKAFVRTGRLSSILSGSQRCLLLSGRWGGSAAKIMKTWPDPFGSPSDPFWPLPRKPCSLHRPQSKKHLSRFLKMGAGERSGYAASEPVPRQFGGDASSGDQRALGQPRPSSGNMLLPSWRPTPKRQLGHNATL
jgi:hypothetical protein